MLLIPAHAKVNLCLAVRGRRPDGFHDIDSVAVTVDWHDLVGVRVERSTETAAVLHVSGAGDLPAGTDNLAVRALHAVASITGPLRAELWLDKRIPSGAGLGGGSADAAAVLRACALLVGHGDLTATALRQLAASLGSDVPMLLAGGVQRMEGRGELLTPLLGAPTLHLALAVAGFSDTAATYAAVDHYDLESGDRPGSLAAALDAGGAPDDGHLGSGLEAAACRVNPALDERLTALRATMPDVRWHLTGSGGAAFALAPGRDEAEELAASARELGILARACRTVGAAT